MGVFPKGDSFPHFRETDAVPFLFTFDMHCHEDPVQ